MGLLKTRSLKSVRSLKNVRFAPELTTVKKFDSDSEPISISSSNQSSPESIPLDVRDEVPEYSLPPILFNTLPIRGSLTSKENDIMFRLGYDDDDQDVRDIDDDEDGMLPLSGEVGDDEDMGLDGLDVDSFDIVDCKIVDTNLVPFIKKFQLNQYKYDQYKDISTIEKMIFDYLHGNNIKLHSLTKKSDKLHGLLYVNNLNFEKFIELKFSFNGWQDIHYTTASYRKSITERIDEFKFSIDLMALKYILKSKNLIYCESVNQDDYTYCHLNMELCCRYDVNNETYYDNNNYNNYQFSLVIVTAPIYVLQAQLTKSQSEPSLSMRNDEDDCKKAPEKSKPDFQSDFLTTTTLSHNSNFNHNSYSRRFSDDTDYYNTSPLKHLYHNDTTLIKPARVNEVLGSNFGWSPGNPDYDAGFLETHSYNSINKPIPTNYTSSAYTPNTSNDVAFNDQSIQPSKLKSKSLPDSELDDSLNFQFFGNSVGIENNQIENGNGSMTPDRKHIYSNSSDMLSLFNSTSYQPDSPNMNGYVTLGEVSDFTSNPNNSSETLVIANMSRSQSASISGHEDSTIAFHGEDELEQYTTENGNNGNDVSPSDTPSSELTSILNSVHSQANSSISEDDDFEPSNTNIGAKNGIDTTHETNDVFNKLQSNQIDYQTILNSYCFYEPRRESYNSTCYDGDDDKNDNEANKSVHQNPQIVHEMESLVHNDT